MIRATHVRPGFDCPAGNCPVTDPPAPHLGGQGHGVGSEYWHFSVIDTNQHVALELMFDTLQYPESVIARARMPLPDFACHNCLFHAVQPRTREQVLAGPQDGGPCEYIGAGCRLYYVGTLEFVNAFCAQHFVLADGLQQKEPFWLALEACLNEEREHHERCRREDGDLKWLRCECCKGEGVLPR